MRELLVKNLETMGELEQGDNTPLKLMGINGRNILKKIEMFLSFSTDETKWNSQTNYEALTTFQQQVTRIIEGTELIRNEFRNGDHRAHLVDEFLKSLRTVGNEILSSKQQIEYYLNPLPMDKRVEPDVLAHGSFYHAFLIFNSAERCNQVRLASFPQIIARHFDIGLDKFYSKRLALLMLNELESRAIDQRIPGTLRVIEKLKTDEYTKKNYKLIDVELEIMDSLKTPMKNFFKILKSLDPVLEEQYQFTITKIMVLKSEVVLNLKLAALIQEISSNNQQAEIPFLAFEKIYQALCPYTPAQISRQTYEDQFVYRRFAPTSVPKKLCAQYRELDKCEAEKEKHLKLTQQLDAFEATHPKHFNAIAWRLAKKYAYNCAPTNQALLIEIHQVAPIPNGIWALTSSIHRTFFGTLLRQKVQAPVSQESIVKALS